MHIFPNQEISHLIIHLIIGEGIFNVETFFTGMSYSSFLVPMLIKCYISELNLEVAAILFSFPFKNSVILIIFAFLILTKIYYFMSSKLFQSLYSVSTTILSPVSTEKM